MKFNPVTGNLETVQDVSGFFLLDQTIPQTVIGGSPIFSKGITLHDLFSQTMTGDFDTAVDSSLVDTADFEGGNNDRQVFRSTAYPNGDVGYSIDTDYHLTNFYATTSIENLDIGTAENNITCAGFLFDSIGRACPVNSSMVIYGISGVVYGDLGTVGSTQHIGFDGRTSGTADRNVSFYGQAQGATRNYAFYAQSGDSFLGSDNVKTFFGTSEDASVYYDGTNFVINPKAVGSGSLSVLGDINAPSLTLPDTTPVFTTHDMQRGTVICYAANLPSTSLSSISNPTNFISYSLAYGQGNLEAERANMAVQDGIFTSGILQEEKEGSPSYEAFMYDVELPEYPEAYYSEMKVRAVFWHKDAPPGGGGSMTDVNLYIYNFATSSWSLLGTSAGDEDIPADMEYTLTGTTVQNCIDGNKAYIMFRNKDAESGDMWWAIDYASVSVKTTKTIIGESMWVGNLEVAGDLAYQGTFIAKDIRMLADNVYQIGSDALRPASITGNIINAYERLNIGHDVYGSADVYSAPFFLSLDNDGGGAQGFLGSFIDWTFTENDPMGQQESDLFFSNSYLYYDKINYQSLNLNNHIWNRHETFRPYQSTSTTLYFSDILNDYYTDWVAESDEFISTPQDGTYNIFRQNNHHARFIAGSTIDAPIRWFGSHYETPYFEGFSTVEGWGWASASNTGQIGASKLYFGLSSDLYAATFASGTYLQYSGGDLDLFTSANKTLELQQPVYEDIQFPVSGAKVPAANYPTWETFTTNTNEYSFTVNDYIDCSANEVPHGWVEGTIGDLHLHLAIKTTNSTGANRFAKFQIIVSLSDATQAGTKVWTELSPFTGELTIPNGAVALTGYYLDMGNITLTGYKIGTQIKVRIKRIAATGGTEYAANVFVNQCGIHTRRDTIGSRQEAVK